MSYNYPNDWYWQVTDSSPSTQVWKSSAGAFVSSTAAAFTTWLTGLSSDPIQNTNLVDTITGISNHGGLVRLSLRDGRAGSWATGQFKTVTGVGGTGAANGAWTITVIDNDTVDLQGSTYNAGDTVSGVIGSGAIYDTAENLYAAINAFAIARAATGALADVANIGGTTITLAASDLRDVMYFTDSTGDVTVTMPEANLPTSLPLGRPITFVNSTNTHKLIVKAYGGGDIATVYTQPDSVTFGAFSNDSQAGSYLPFGYQLAWTAPTNNAAYVPIGQGASDSVAWTPFSGDISLAQNGVTAYAGTVPVNKGGTGQMTVATAQNAFAIALLYSKGDVNFNAGNTDTSFALPLPSGFTRYRIIGLFISGASHDLTTATFGVFTATGGGGTALYAGGTAITVSATAENTPNNMQSLAAVAGTISFTTSPVFFRVMTAEGAAATGTVTILYEPVS